MTRQAMDRQDAIRKEIKSCNIFLDVTLKAISFTLSEETTKAIKEAVEKRIVVLDKEFEEIQ